MFGRDDGHVTNGGEVASIDFAAVRPVLWVTL